MHRSVCGLQGPSWKLLPSCPSPAGAAVALDGKLPIVGAPQTQNKFHASLPSQKAPAVALGRPVPGAGPPCVQPGAAPGPGQSLPG